MTQLQQLPRELQLDAPLPLTQQLEAKAWKKKKKNSIIYILKKNVDHIFPLAQGHLRVAKKKPKQQKKTTAEKMETTNRK